MESYFLISSFSNSFKFGDCFGPSFLNKTISNLQDSKRIRSPSAALVRLDMPVQVTVRPYWAVSWTAQQVDGHDFSKRKNPGNSKIAKNYHVFLGFLKNLLSQKRNRFRSTHTESIQEDQPLGGCRRMENSI